MQIAADVGLVEEERGRQGDRGGLDVGVAGAGPDGDPQRRAGAAAGAAAKADRDLGAEAEGDAVEGLEAGAGRDQGVIAGLGEALAGAVQGRGDAGGGRSWSG